jgi:hypothetical protein
MSRPKVLFRGDHRAPGEVEVVRRLHLDAPNRHRRHRPDSLDLPDQRRHGAARCRDALDDREHLAAEQLGEALGREDPLLAEGSHLHWCSASATRTEPSENSTS